ncbi:MAG: electron transport protein SCO1/SenC [Magnetococcales bacterium]|nr:electron transport protein SCO1/SenC [Magnetococcales bacterium]HIJ82920.1 SCO family protein [Magnetococcales bacterium]
MIGKYKFLLLLLVLTGAGASIFHLQTPSNRSATAASPPQGPLIPAKDLAEFHLIDHQGLPFGLKQLQGSWSMIFFGYTQCPDICPTSLMLMAEAVNILEKKGVKDFKGILVSVDPQRDTPAVLKHYVQYMHPAFIGISGTRGEIDNLVKQMGVAYIIHPPKDPKDSESYAITHSSSIYFVNPQGRLVDMIMEPKVPEEIAQKAQALRNAKGP